MNASVTRQQNASARRSHIISTAAGMVAEAGVQALTLRELALAADVTVPTIYNLVGSKEAVIGAFISQALDTLDKELAELPDLRGIDRSMAIMNRTFDLYFSDSKVYRAVFRGMRELDPAQDKLFLGRLFRRAGAFHERAVNEARVDGHLLGNLKALPLAHNALHAQHGATQMWAARTLSRDLARARGQYGLLVAFLADATPKGRRYIIPMLSQAEKLLDR